MNIEKKLKNLEERLKLKKLTDNKQHYRLKRNASKHYSLFMFTKLYKIIEDKGLHYKEMWFDDTKNAVIIHWGKVGFVGKTEEYSMTIEEAKD